MGVFYSKTAKIRGSFCEDQLLSCLEDMPRRIKEEVVGKCYMERYCTIESVSLYISSLYKYKYTIL